MLPDKEARLRSGTTRVTEKYQKNIALKKAEEDLALYYQELEAKVRERTEELAKTVKLMVGREIRMVELKKAIIKLQAQIEEAGLRPVFEEKYEETMKMEGDE